MATKSKDIDSRDRTIENEIEATSESPARAIWNPQFVKTVGRLWHSSRRFSWTSRYELEGDMSIRDLGDGSRFDPVKQFTE